MFGNAVSWGDETSTSEVTLKAGQLPRQMTWKEELRVGLGKAAGME